MTTVEGVSRVVERPRPDSDVIVSDVVVTALGQDGADIVQLVRVVGLEAVDYLTTTEALALARALVAASSPDDEPATG